MNRRWITATTAGFGLFLLIVQGFACRATPPTQAKSRHSVTRDLDTVMEFTVSGDEEFLSLVRWVWPPGRRAYTELWVAPLKAGASGTGAAHVAGGVGKTVTDTLQWNPERPELLYQVIQKARLGTEGTLYRYQAPSEVNRPLIHLPAPGGGANAWFWTPQGDGIVMQVEDDEIDEIWFLGRDGAVQRKEKLPPATKGEFLDLAGIVDKERLLFFGIPIPEVSEDSEVSDVFSSMLTYERLPTLYLYDRGQGRLRMISRSLPPIRMLNSRRELLVLYEHNEAKGQVRLGVYDLRTNRMRPLNWVSLYHSFYPPDPSPDGSRAVFAAESPGGGSLTLSTIDLESGAVRPLFTTDGHPLLGRKPRWHTKEDIVFIRSLPTADLGSRGEDGPTDRRREEVCSYSLRTKQISVVWSPTGAGSLPSLKSPR